MRPILLWSKEPSWLSVERYPGIHEQFQIDLHPSDTPLPAASRVLVLDEALLETNLEDVRRFAQPDEGTALPVVVVSPEPETNGTGEEFVFEVLGRVPSEKALLRTLRNASYFLETELRLKESQAAAERKAKELEELNAIGVALSAERDHDRLLNLILSKSREITNADAGSLFLVASIDMRLDDGARAPDETGGAARRVSGRWLRFRLAQNDSRESRFEEDILAIGPESIAGYVAETGETLNLEDAYHLPADKPFVINRSFDEATGYRTRSMLVVPMQNHDGENIGVLQLLNKKRSREVLLDSPESFEEEVLPFSSQDEQMVRSLASQAAVSVENNDLYNRIEKLFADFVEASVRAIESRDKTTQGHSRRVALMTTELARVANRAERGAYRDFELGRDEIRELKYAALLHDFGKVGVTEKVLVKATKLYHGEMSLVDERFRTIRRTLETSFLRRVLDQLAKGEITLDEIPRMETALQIEFDKLDDALRSVKEANKPTVTHSSGFDHIEAIAKLTFPDTNGAARPYLEAKELTSLSVPQGSLTKAEYHEIQSHVDHTFAFLATIPWTRDLQNIPHIARSHHEKLDGSGYPNRLAADQIPPQTRMMTIADIYDALTARDRPYKPAVPTTTALGILEAESKAGRIDGDLLELFIEGKVFERGLTNS